MADDRTTTAETTDPGPARADRPGRARPDRRTLAVDAAVLIGLAGVAITQPLLDLFGNNPTFFVAGNYGRRQIVMFALVVAFVPGAVAVALSTPFALVGRRASRAAHAVAVAVLAGLFGLVLGQTLGVDATLPAFALALVVGVGVALAEARYETVRRFLAYLALGNLVFVGLFVFASPTNGLLRGGFVAAQGEVTGPGLPGPVVVVVLDEFPLVAILREDGTINEERYPNLAALAERTTWFRNASAESSSTYVSVPSILTGRHVDADSLPVLRDHPRNLFTLFGDRYPVRAYEPVTHLCPVERCGAEPSQPLRQALSDAWVVYRHRVLPEALREGLPPIDQGWGNFGGGVGGGDGGASLPASDESWPTTSSGRPDPMARLDEVPRHDAGRVGQAAALRREIAAIRPIPSITMIHVLLPHHPYQLTPWGLHSTNTWVPAQVPEEGDPRLERVQREVAGLQELQIGAVDQMIGELMDHLDAQGAWDSTTLVVVSDHGLEVLPRFDRSPNTEARETILRIPLFIKAAGQTTGEVRDDPATTIDVLPSLVDLLDIETDWEMDGHSLFDGSEPGYEREVTTGVDSLLELVRERRRVLPDGDGWDSVAAIGEHGDLVGTAVADHEVGPASELSWSFDGREALADPAAAGGAVPVLMRGTVHGDRPPAGDLVVALDGVIAGTLGGYVETDDGWAFSGLLGPEVEGGAREVVAYEVERAGGTVTLHPLVT